jgi:hypothetical protein
VCLLLPCLPGQAQTLQRLEHHLRPAVASGQARLVGALPPEQRLQVSLVLPLRNQDQLASLIDRLYDPASPDYRQFLSVEQFTAEFCPTAEDYLAVLDFARSNGLTVTGTPANRLIVPLSGTVAQMEKAFHVRMNLYQHPREERTFYSPDREPALELRVPVARIAGLNNYSLPRPLVTRADAAQAAILSAVTGSGPGGAYLPSDMRAAYYGGTELTGKKQAVGLAEFDGYNVSDLVASFDGAATESANGSNYLLTYTPVAGGAAYTIPINNVLLDGATGKPCQLVSPCADAEQTLDIAQAIGMAPGLSQVRVYIGKSDVDVLNAMAAENLARQLSISWSWSPDDPATDDPIFQEFAAQGQSVFAASGDYGGYNPEYDEFYPGEDAWVTTVGGTDMVTEGVGGAWSAETAWNRSGGGVSPDQIPLPHWQTGVANALNGGSTTLRNAPDVAAEADQDNYACDLNTCLSDYGGTSFAAPRWAGFMALVNQHAAAEGNMPVGFLNPGLYAIVAGSGYDSELHDIVSGNNDYSGSAYSFNAVAGYDLVTGWGSPAGAGLIDALTLPYPAGFRLSVSPSSLTLGAGASAKITVKVVPVGKFSGSVNLTIAGLPSGVSAVFKTNPASASSLLTLSASKSALRGSCLLTITGTNGSLSATTTVALDVNAPGFSLSPQPTEIQLYPGSFGSGTIWISTYAGFSSSVNLAVTSTLPKGVFARWSSNPASLSSQLMLTADSSATASSVMVAVTGTSGAQSETTSLTLLVHPPNFNLSISPYPFFIAQGHSVTATVTVVPNGGFAGSVVLASGQLPSGVTATFTPASTATSSVLTMTAKKSAPTGESGAVIKGNGSAWASMTAFAQTVTATTASTFNLGVAPPSMTLNQGSCGVTTVQVTRLGGFKGEVTLSATSANGLSAGVTASFSKNPTAGKSVLTLTASSAAAPGNYTLQVEGASGSQSTYANLFLTVNPPPSFSLTASPNALSVPLGASVTFPITVTPQTGFSGKVTLAASNLPAGLTASFASSSAKGPNTLKLLTQAPLLPGIYTVIVIGSSGTQIVSVPLTLQVTAPRVGIR